MCSLPTIPAQRTWPSPSSGLSRTGPPHRRSLQHPAATDAQIEDAIQRYHDLGIKVVLKPHVDLIDYSSWRGELAPSNVAEWFTSYQDYIVHYAQVAQQYNVDGLSIGTELKSLSGADNLPYWQALIKAVRAAYTGPIMYGANATGPGDEFTSVSFWSLVDILGVDGYFGLTGHADPTVAQLETAWTDSSSPYTGSGFNAVAALKNLSSQYNKPVVFTEVGYESSKGTNEEPYAQLDNGYDPTEQENCYTAFFKVFSQETSWMHGVFWWALQLPVPAAGDQGWVMYSKPAGAVMTQWYGGDTADFTVAPVSASVTVGRGLTATDTIAVRESGSFSAAVTLSASGLPSGVTAKFSVNPTTSDSVLSLAASATATLGGPVKITIKGVSGARTASAAISLTVQAPIAQTITFANPGTQTVGTPLALAAKATSGLPVTYSTTTATICTVSDATDTASFLKAGACTITASQPGNGIYSAAAPKAQSFTVNALASLPIPAAADVIVSQVNWLNTLNGNAFVSSNSDGSSFAVNSAGDIVVANTNNLVLFSAATGAATTLGSWASASAVAVDSHNNIYIGNLYGPLQTSSSTSGCQRNLRAVFHAHRRHVPMHIHGRQRMRGPESRLHQSRRHDLRQGRRSVLGHGQRRRRRRQRHLKCTAACLAEPAIRCSFTRSQLSPPPRPRRRRDSC